MELQGYLSWPQQPQYDKQATFQYNVGDSLTILELKNTNHLSIIVQQDAIIYSFIIFLHTAVHVSSDTLTHHQEHM